MQNNLSATVEAALAEAKTTHEAGELSAAGRLYRRILRKEPNYAPALNLYGILASQRGDARNAVKRLERAVAEDGNTLDYRINLGAVLESSGDFDRAFDCYREALEHSPRNGDILARLSEATKDANRYQDLADTLDGVCTAHPGNAEALHLHGMALYMLHRTEEAVESLQRATELAPGNAHAHANLGSALMDMGRPEEALAACETCLRLHPGESYALATKVIALEELGEYEQLRPLIDFEALLEVRMLEPPAGFDDIGAFNDALEAAVLAHPTLRRDPNHRSCHFADQTDDLFLDPKEPFIALKSMVQAAGDEYRHKLSRDSEYPFLATPAPKTELVSWGNVYRSQGHQGAHIHATSWLSACYYVRVPDLVRRGDNSHKGWIAFGQPPDHYPVTKEPDISYFEPVEGKLVVFPSYLYHRTVPFEDDALRISIAFDFDPTMVR